MANLLGNRVLFLLSAFHVAFARYLRVRVFSSMCFFQEIVLPLSLVYLHVVLKRKDGLAFSFVVFKSSNFDETRFTSVL